MFRIGFSYDAHRFAPERDLILGGVKIPHQKGLLGHSDADVLCHTIGEAILGALSLGDLGKHFPDNDPKYRNISSLSILSYIMDMVRQQKGGVVNVDSTIVAEEPKLAGYIEKMRENLSRVLRININQVSVKATTNEGMGFAGRKEGIAAYAVVLVEKE
jgi:2-C-methyl-D-erythritol 2,4-cyclodiphosphate synthase